MKIRFSFKDPDALGHGIVKKEGEWVPFVSGEDAGDVFDELVDKYINYGDYVYVEYDTETMEMRVVPLDEED